MAEASHQLAGSGADPSPPEQGGAAWWHPSAAVERTQRSVRTVERRLAAQPLARLSLAAPRAARFIGGEIVRRLDPSPSGVPPAPLTPSLVGQVVMDESIMALAVGPNRFPRRADYERVGDEIRRAHRLFDKRGWIEDPASFHRAPPPLEEPAVTRGWALGTRYERLWWPSGFEPRLGVPGTDRWLAFEANRTASAWVLRHRDGPRPWLVCIHGLGTGSTFMDLITFRAPHLHHDLGVNIAALVLPVHGARRPSRFSGEEFLGFELMNVIHGLSQALWDARSLLSWVRAQDPTLVGVFGVSLGALVSSLVAAFDPQLDAVIAGIPIVDFPDMVRHHAPRHLLMRGIEHNILDDVARDVHRVVSPFAFPVLAPRRSRAIFAGLGDRLATTDQARRLWELWEEPDTCWFPGNHVGYLWSEPVWQFVDRVLDRRGFNVGVR